MNETTSTAQAEEINQAAPAASVESQPVIEPQPTVKEVLSKIQIDSQSQPEAYLEQVEVPGGGE